MRPRPSGGSAARRVGGGRGSSAVLHRLHDSRRRCVVGCADRSPTTHSEIQGRNTASAAPHEAAAGVGEPARGRSVLAGRGGGRGGTAHEVPPAGSGRGGGSPRRGGPCEVSPGPS